MMKIRTRMENFAKRHSLVFIYYRDYAEDGKYEDINIHYKDYILGASIKNYARFSIFNGLTCEREDYLDLTSAFKAMRKIIKEN